MWLKKYPDFTAKYARAKEIQCESMAAEMLRLADECREGVRKKQTLNAKGEVEYETMTADMIDRARLQVETRKWLLSKMYPKKYGDRLELAGDPDNPVMAQPLIVQFVSVGDASKGPIVDLPPAAAIEPGEPE